MLSECIVQIAQQGRNSGRQYTLYFFISLGCPQLMSSSVTSRCILGLLGNMTSCANDTCSRCCGTPSCFINERLTSLFIVCFIQQVPKDPHQGRFTIETTLQRQRRFEIHREQQRRRQASTSISLLAQE